MTQYFDREPAASSRPGSVRLVLPDLTVTLQTDRGVFSADAVDRGTKLLLLEAPHPPPEGDVADIGCGYGPIAVALARRSPAATVWAVDVNARARRLTEVNAATLGLSNVRVVGPDGVPPGTSLAAVYSNPPVRIGKAALQQLLGVWLERLAPGAHAYLVVHKHLGSDSLAVWLGDHGWTARRLVSRMGYRVLDVSAGP
jgi:16S rRNA (guanine1207-N2)-methyltransferase